MRVSKTEGEQEFEVQPDFLGGDGWRRRIRLKGRRSLALKALMLVLLVAAGAWALYANVRSGGPAMDMNMRITSGATPFPVAVAPVERGPIAGTVVYTGSVAPFNEEDVYPRVTGRIVEMMVYPGDAVRPGQVLARLDSVELSSRVREAEAALAAARNNRVQMEKELAMTEAEAVYARAVAARTERLFNAGAVSKQEYENDSAMAAVAEAKREAARAKVAAAESMLAQSEAVSRTAGVVRGYTDIVASTSGNVVKRLVAPGVLVQPGTPVLKVVQIDKVRLQANVGEKDLGSIRVGSPVQVLTTAADRPPINATVTAVFPFVDQGPRTAVVEALVDNAARRLFPGQYVTMKFVTGQRDRAITVPVSAVVRMEGKGTAWVVKDGRAEARAVVTGLQSADRVEIVEGLADGERVIARGHEGLYAGAKVNEVSPPGSPAVPAAAPSSSPPEPKQEMPSMPGMKH
jgi:RND family efflux transporter MFP subunit